MNLLCRCKDGDRKAQKEVYDLLAPKMYSLCIRYTGDKVVAQDILQEGFITLFSKIETYLGKGSFEGWARKIFVNTALMHIRKNDALKESEDIEEAYGMVSDITSAVEDMTYKELMEMITQLPTGFRTVFNMYIIEGYTHKEIGEILGITETTSRSQLKRARECLKHKIDARQQRKHE